jgi:Cupin superfamily protein
MSLSLEDLVAPVSTHDFFSEVSGQRHAFYPGSSGRFSEIFSWESLNRVLDQHNLAFPRMRLAQRGTLVPPDLYTSSDEQDPSTRRLRIPELTALVRRGCTLVIDAFDELDEAVGDLTRSLERSLRARVSANAFAVWNSTQGFDIHWDAQDVFALQVCGAKKWNIHGYTRRWPLLRDIERNNTPPAHTLDELHLKSGDALYVPRGCWHSVEVLEAPSLHLTLTVTSDTGADFGHWLVDQLLGNDVFRQDLPRFGTPDAKQQHLEALRSSLLAAVSVEAMDRFFVERDGLASTRRGFSFPASGMSDPIPEGADVEVTFVAPRGALRQSSKHHYELLANGQAFELSRDAVPLVESLLDGRTYLLSDLQGQVHRRVGVGATRELVAQLCERGLVKVSLIADG